MFLYLKTDNAINELCIIYCSVLFKVIPDTNLGTSLGYLIVFVCVNIVVLKEHYTVTKLAYL